jgi:hypothetical protein
MPVASAPFRGWRKGPQAAPRLRAHKYSLIGTGPGPHNPRPGGAGTWGQRPAHWRCVSLRSGALAESANRAEGHRCVLLADTHPKRHGRGKRQGNQTARCWAVRWVGPARLLCRADFRVMVSWSREPRERAELAAGRLCWQRNGARLSVSVSVSVPAPLCLSVCLSVFLSFCLSFCLSVCLSPPNTRAIPHRGLDLRCERCCCAYAICRIGITGR